MRKTLLIKIIFLIAIVILPCFLNKTSALALHDCDTITWDIKLFGDYSLNGELLKFSNVYPKEALEMAIKNLTSYCCRDILKQWKAGPDARCKDADKLSIPWHDWPDSPYLFDHLIDVGLRRLDALNNYPDVQADPTWIARRVGSGDDIGSGDDNRKWIKTEAESTDVTSPLKIVNGYKFYRTLSGAWMFKKIHLKIENMSTGEIWTLATFLGEYNNQATLSVSLADKYNNLCRIARNIYEKKPWQEVVIWWDKLSKGRSYYTDCQGMVANRINQENIYVKGILINKAADMLQKNFEAIHKQFVQDKLTALQETISRIRDMIQTVVRQAPYCTKCSK